MPINFPSRLQVKPWNGQRSSRQLPSRSLSSRPRCRQALGKARIASAALRTTSTESEAISYTTKSPTAGRSSSRHAICQTRFHSRSTSSSCTARET